jgi:WD40 repeat protein
VAALAVVGVVYQVQLQAALREARAAQARVAERELTLRRHRYGYDIKAVPDAWEKGNVARVLELLDAHRPQPGQEDVRGFEWYYYRALCHDEVLSLRTRATKFVAWSPDGRTLATAGPHAGFDDRMVTLSMVSLWDAGTGQPLHAWLVDGGVTGLAFSADGKTLAAGAGKAVLLWDLTTRQEREPLKEPDWVTAIAFAPKDGSRLAVASASGGMGSGAKERGNVRIWDLATGAARSLVKDAPSRVHAIAFCPDGRTLAAGSEAEVVLLDAATGGVRVRLGGGTSALAFSPDGKTLARYRDASGAVALVDPATGKEQDPPVPHDRLTAATGLTFSPDGGTLAAAAGTVVHLWDVAARQEKGTYRGHVHAITSLAFSPDGKRLAAVSDTPLSAREKGEVKVWDVTRPQGPETVALPQGHSEINALTFSADGKTLTVRGTRHGRLLRDLPEGVEGDLLFEPRERTGRHHVLDFQTITPAPDTFDLTTHSLNLRRVAYSPGGKTVATASDRGDRSVKLWDAGTGRELRTLRRDAPCYAVAFSPDGRTLAVVGLDRTVTLWDPATATERATLRGHPRWIDALAFSPDGRTLATGSYDGTAKLWDVASRRERAALPRHADMLLALAFSPDGRTLVTGCRDTANRAVVKLWDADTGRERGAVAGCNLTSHNMAFSPDSKLLALYAGDRAAKKMAVKLCDAATGRERASFPAHNNQVTCLAFSPDGRTLASGSWDETVKLCDVAEGKPLASLAGPGWVECLAFSPDGATLVAGGRDNTARLWDTATHVERAVLRVAVSGNVNAIAFSPDGRTLATTGINGPVVKLCDVATGKERGALQAETSFMKPVLFAPDGQTMVTDTFQAMRLWGTTTGKQKAVLGPTADERGWTGVMAATPDGRALLFVRTGKVPVATLWDGAARRERAALTGFDSPVTAAAFTPGGSLLATRHEDGTARLWDAADGRQRLVFQAPAGGAGVNCLAFAPDGKVLATGCGDNTVRLWDEMAMLAVFPGRSAFRALTFAPNGPLLAAAEEGGAVRLWDRTTSEERASLRRDQAGQAGPIDVMAFAPDGRTLATGQAGALKLWDTATGLERLTLWEPAEDIRAVAFSPDGKTLAAATYRTLKLWHGATQEEVLARDR